MTLSDLSIRKPVFAWMLMAAMIIFGWISFNRMGISQMPDVDFPVVTVQVTLDGAAPEVMETDVVDIIEDAVMNVQGVVNVTSNSKNGSASISVEFELDRNIDAALQEVQTKIAQAQRLLPREMDPPVITKTNPEDQPILWLTASSDNLPLPELMALVRDRIKDQFSTVRGVGDVFLGGYIDPNLRVWVDPAKLTRFDMTVNDIISTIQAEHSELPGGQIENGDKLLNVRTLGEAKSIEEFGKIFINSRGNMPNYNPTTLSQVTRIEEGLAEVKRLSRFNGKPAVGLGIRKQRGSNAVEVARAVKSKIEAVNKGLPKGTSIGINFDTTRFIEKSVHELNFALVLSVIFTSIVCWGFLGSWSATFNVLMSIPTSIVGAFTALYALGFTLNTFTLLGLSLAIGIVVDDAIMVLENIVRHRENGMKRMQAAIFGTREITFAAMAATVAIVAIFLPVAFMKGIIGKFFFQFGVTMTVAVLFSLVEALTLTPMRCARFVETGHRTTRIGRGIEALLDYAARLYRRTLEVALDHPWKVLAASVVFFGGTMFAASFINKEFSPSQDQGTFMIRLQTPVGSSLPFTDSKFKEAEAFLASRPEVERYYVAVGGFGGGGDTNSGVMFVTMKERGKRPKSPKTGNEVTQQEFMNICRASISKIPKLKPVIQDLSMRGFTSSRGFPVEFSVRGPEWEKLGEYAREIMSRMDKSGLMTDVDTDYLLGMPELQITPNRQQASLRGVSIASIGQTVNAMVGGVVAGRYPKNGHRYDIRVQLPHNVSRAEEVDQLFVRNNRGERIRLADLVTKEVRPSLQQIVRMNRERAVSVFANVKQGKSQQKALEEVQKIAQEVLPAGYRIELSGSSQTFKESFNSLIFALLLGIVVAYMVLGSQFNSFIDPVTVLLALPFSVSGALVALLIAGQSLNIYSFIGLILLMGIVKKNSILLVEFTNQVRDSGLTDVRAALLKACPIRLRPILMTSIATIAAAIPEALSLGEGAETRIPMAVAVIGGVLVSTVLTLLVVPCAYRLFARLGKRDEDRVETRKAFEDVEKMDLSLETV